MTHTTHADATLRESEERHRLLFQSNPLPMWVYDLETLRILDVNRAAVRSYGYSLEEFLALTIRDFRPEETLGRLEQSLRSLDEGARATGTWQHRKKSGEVIDVEVTSEPIDFGGRKARLVLANDISARRRAEEALRESDERLRATFEQAAVGIAHADPEGRYLRVNDQLCAITGYSRAELMGLTALALTAPEDYSLVAGVRQDMLEGRLDSFRSEARILRKDGATVWVSRATTLVRHPDGAPGYFISVIEDISLRKAAEERLRRLNRLHAVLSRVGEEIVRATSQPRLWESVCRIAVEEGLLRMATVFTVGTAPGEMPAARPSVSFGDPPAGLEGVSIALQGPQSNGTVGTALREGRSSVCNDVASDPRMEPWHTLALSHGFGSAAAFPIRAEDGPPAALLLLAREPDFFREDEVQVLGLVAENLSLAAESLRRDRRRAAAEQALRESEQRFRNVSRATADTVWDWDFRNGTVWWNEGMERVFGYSPEELGPSTEAWSSRIHGDDRDRVVSGIHAVVNGGGEGWSDEYRFRRRDGSYAFIRDRGFVIRSPDGAAVRMVGGMEDLSVRKEAELGKARAHRALRMLSACNETLVRSGDEAELLAEVCRIAVEVGGYRMAWVGYAKGDPSRAIVPMARAGHDAGYLDEARLSWVEDEPAGSGPGGRTIRSGRAQLSADISADTSFGFRDAAARRGFQGVICLPLRDGNRTFGLLGLYSGAVLTPSEDEVKLLGDLADNLAFGIGSLRLRAEQQRLQETLLAIARGVSTRRGADFFEGLTSEMLRALRAGSGIIAQVRSPERAEPKEQVNGRGAPRLELLAAAGETRGVAALLAGAPWEVAARGEDVLVTRDLEQAFPGMPSVSGFAACAAVPLLDARNAPVGIVAALFPEPLEDAAFAISALRIFATHAASELGRQRADAHLEEKAALLDAAREAIFVRDLDDRIVYWNKGAERTYGWSPEEALGREAASLLHRDPKGYLGATQTLFETGEWQGTVEKLTKAGKPIIVDVRWTLVRNAEGRPRSVLAINTDVTERKRLESHLLRAQRMESIGTLAGGIAHDLNNVLAPILLSIELLRGEVRTEDGTGLLDTLQLSSERAADLVRQVLSFARGVEGQRVAVSPRLVGNEVSKILRETFPKNVEILFEMAHDVWLVSGDATQLHQVLMNLCVNARDAMPQGGQLRVTMSNVTLDDVYAGMTPDASPGPYVLIRVADTGSGIPPEIRDRIFDPFFTTKDLGHGTGLGLSTTLAIVRSHGGFINVYSEPGRGTKVKVYLPAALDGSLVAPQRSAPEAERLPSGKGELVLVVDDEAAIRGVAQRTLEAFGYRVVLAANGAEAVALYARRQGEIAIVLTDMAMPVMDGPATIVALRALDPKVRIVGSSGLTANGGVARAVGAGVAHFIPKPYTAEAMLTVLARALREPA